MDYGGKRYLEMVLAGKCAMTGVGRIWRVERLNSEGIPREQLAWALGQRKIVEDARSIDSCLLCRGPRVNEAALCDVCWPLLSEAEGLVAQSWLVGGSP